MGLLIVSAIVAVYFLPTIVALGRYHQSSAAIFLVNILGAWTGVLWIVALVWSLTGVRSDQPIIIRVHERPIEDAPPVSTAASA